MTLETLKRLYKHYTDTNQPDRAGQVLDKAKTVHDTDLSIEEEPEPVKEETKSKRRR